jgi:biotin operon repressor
MQVQLPFFPSETRMINSFVGFRSQDGYVYYLHNGNPIYCHGKDDRNGYRFILGSLVMNNLCSVRELSDALGEHRKNVERYAKSLREKGMEYFFQRKEHRGDCHKMQPSLLEAIQQDIDSGLSIYRMSKNHNISESAISYHLKKGTLKKKLLPL